MSRKQPQIDTGKTFDDTTYEPKPIQQRGDSPREIAAVIHEIKIGLENQRRIADARFMQLHQHLDLKYGINPQRAIACFDNARDSDEKFHRCLQPLPSAEDILEQEKKRGGDAPRRKRGD